MQVHRVFLIVSSERDISFFFLSFFYFIKIFLYQQDSPAAAQPLGLIFAAICPGEAYLDATRNGYVQGCPVMLPSRHWIPHFALTQACGVSCIVSCRVILQVQSHGQPIWPIWGVHPLFEDTLGITPIEGVKTVQREHVLQILPGTHQPVCILGVTGHAPEHCCSKGLAF